MRNSNDSCFPLVSFKIIAAQVVPILEGRFGAKLERILTEQVLLSASSFRTWILR